jgi:UDP-GlcNAc:undecaprenyl-phosphate GlcNAc-1-phosphate transferase
MSAITAVGFIAFLLCLIATPLCREIFLRFGIVDHPDTERKFHMRPIPRIGGIPIVLSYAGALGLMFVLAPQHARITIQHQTLLLSLLPATTIIFVVGLVDDIVGLRPRQKLAGQFAAALLAVGLGVRISTLHGLPASAWITIPFSVIWLVGCSNAVNLIDGLDGLASGVGLFATLATLVAALITGNMGLAIATVPLAGALLAFLRYNFSPASIFLGDCGSLTIGFMLGCFGLIWSQNKGTLVGMALPLMALALPLLDVLLSIGRRKLRSVPIFKGDRGHIHHMVLARGFQPHTSALILYGCCALAATLALLQTFASLRFRGPILLIFGGLVWVGVNYLGYVEIHAVRRVLSRKRLLSLLKDEIYLQDLDLLLAKAVTIVDFWDVVRSCCKDLNVASVRMRLRGSLFEENFEPHDPEPVWVLKMDFGEEGSLVITRSSDSRPPSFMLNVLEYLQGTAFEREKKLALEERAYTGAAAGGERYPHSDAA